MGVLTCSYNDEARNTTYELSLCITYTTEYEVFGRVSSKTMIFGNLSVGSVNSGNKGKLNFCK